ncbi:MAG: EthD family reductase [Jatrophihabitans sp.]
MASPATFLVLYATPNDPEAFDHHYEQVHTPLARALPGLRSYTLGRHPVTMRGDATYYLAATLRWDTIAELRAAFATPEGHAAAEDMQTLTLLTTVTSIIYTEDAASP